MEQTATNKNSCGRKSSVVRFVRTSFLDVRDGSRPFSGRYGGGRHGWKYVVLRLGAPVEGGLTNGRTRVTWRAMTVDGPRRTTLTPRRVVQQNIWHRHEIRNVNKNLDDTFRGKKTLGRPRNRWKNQLKSILKPGCRLQTRFICVRVGHNEEILCKRQRAFEFRKEGGGGILLRSRTANEYLLRTVSHTAFQRLLFKPS